MVNASERACLSNLAQALQLTMMAALELTVSNESAEMQLTLSNESLTCMTKSQTQRRMFAELVMANVGC